MKTLSRGVFLLSLAVIPLLNCMSCGNNSSGWQEVSSGITGPLFGVWGNGPNDIWTVGTDNFNFAILHWDGNNWSSKQASGGDSGILHALWGSGPNDVWAVGQGGAILRYRP